MQLDWCVGELLKTLDRLNLTEKTLVVFCSDNGPVLDDGYKDLALGNIGNHRAAGPFAGGKYSVYEGGTRTPFITRWRGRIAPGVSDEMVCTIDLASSLAALTGATLPDQACLDSMNVIEALLGKPGARGRDHLVQQDNGMRNNYGLRVGNWKLLRHDSKLAYNHQVETRLANTKVARFQLFDLSTDPGETTDLYEKRPEIAKRLTDQLAGIIESGRSR